MAPLCSGLSHDSRDAWRPIGHRGRHNARVCRTSRLRNREDFSGGSRLGGDGVAGPGVLAGGSLLHYATMLLMERGWTVRQVWWDEGDKTSVEAAVARARRELDAVTAQVHLVVAKSLGTMALPDAAERGLPGVWLTPILNDPKIAAALRRLSVPALLVGGTADPLW